MIAGLVLAAGEGRRFGAATKQLAPIDGRPLLQHAVDAMAASSVDRVVVTLGYDAEAIADRIAFGRAETLRVDDWDEGQAASLRAGVAALADADAIVVTLGDQPRISAAAIDRVAAAAGLARASYEGVPGHPVRMPREAFATLAQLRGDTGARDLLGDAVLVPCDELGTSEDVDTPTPAPDDGPPVTGQAAPGQPAPFAPGTEKPKSPLRRLLDSVTGIFRR